MRPAGAAGAAGAGGAGVPVRDAPAAVLALDAGQSGVRARMRVGIASGAGGTGGTGGAGGADPVVLDRGVRPLDAPGAVAAIVEVLGSAGDAAHRGAAGAVDVAAISLSGFGAHAAGADALGLALAERLGAARVVVAHDAVCAHLGALAGRPGVIAAVGTGSVVLGLGPDGAVARVDGAGHLLGDAGSAYAIGRRGLEAALRAHDGRGTAEELRARAAARFGSLDELPVRIFARDPVKEVAAFARDVAALARDGDPAARAIWAEGAQEVAASVLAAVRRTHPLHAEVAVCLLGGAFAAEDLLVAPVRAAVTASWPRARHADPAGTALDGAERLARGEHRGPFAPWIREWATP